MLKSRKENKVETITMILISKYIIRRIVPINHVKKEPMYHKVLVILQFDMKIVFVCCCMMHGEPLWWTGLA